MSLNDALYIATSGLANINQGFAVISQNVANAGNIDYAREVPTSTSMSAGDLEMGVRTGPVRREVNLQLQANLFLQNSASAALTTRQTALQVIDSVQGTPGAGSDLPSLLGKLQSTFSTLVSDPASQTQQQAVVAAAGALAGQINTLSAAYQSARQNAQDAMVADVSTLNQTLGTIQGLSQQIILGKSLGQSTADTENQRDAAIHSLTQLVDVRVIPQANGDIQMLTGTGLSLPSINSGAQFALAAATTGANAFYPGGGLPGITLNGSDVTGQLTGGRIGANVTLRDTTLPTYQAETDEFAQTLSSRFDAQGLTLFTDATGALPVSSGPPVQTGYVGYGLTVRVNPAVAATPRLVRDGTQAIAGSGTGASAFTPNPAGGPSGFNTLAQRILDFALGAQAQSGVPQPLPNMTALGPAGTLTAPFTATSTLQAFSVSLVNSQAQDSAATSTEQAAQTALQSSLQSKLSAASGVNIDSEMATMIRLQNAYGANAKVISGVQAMWTALLAIVP